MKRAEILITGAGGLVGSQVTRLLHESGYIVTGIYQNKNLVVLPWNCLYTDLSSESLDNIISNLSISTIIHCAAKIPLSMDRADEVSAINRKIDNNVIDFVRKRKIDIVFISSTSIYGFNNRINSEEDDVIAKDHYSKVKYETEKGIATLNSVSGISLRINAPYFFLQKNRTVLKIFMENALSGRDILYNGTGSRKQDFTHVADIAEAVKLSVETKQAGIYNISGGNPISMEALAHLIKGIIPGCNSRIRSSGKDDPQETYSATFNINKAKNKLGWEPKITLKQGLSEWIANS